MRGAPWRSGTISSGSCSSIVPTSVRTMWRRNESAVISSSTASPRSCQRASSTVRTKTLVLRLGRGEGAEVVLADQHRGRGAEPLEVERPRMPERAVDLERRALAAAPDAVAVRTRARREARVEARGPPRTRRTARSSGKNGVQRLDGPLGRRASVDVDRDDVRERVHPGVGAPGDDELRPHVGRACRKAPADDAPRSCARPAAAPSRGSRCRRTRSSASGARQAPLTSLVRAALCSIDLHFDVPLAIL